MPVPQSGAVLNLLLLFLFGGGGWFFAAWMKTAPVRHHADNAAVVTAGAPRNEPGVFTADALHVLAAAKAGPREFDELVARYGSGTSDLRPLATTVMEKWAAADPAGALSAGLPRCLEHAPDALPQAMAALGARAEIAVGALMAALPDGPLRSPCIGAIAAAWGRVARDEALTQTANLNRGERTLFLSEWHRARGGADLAAARKSASSFPEADDREAGLRGCLLARAAVEPEPAVREAANREDFPLIAQAAFRQWLTRDAGAAWSFATSFKEDPALPGIATALLKADAGHRHLSDTLPELTTLLSRLFPAANPPEVPATLVPVLVSERVESAQRFIEQQPGHPDIRRTAGAVVFFDSLCRTDPAAAWRFAESCVQLEGAKDGRAAHHWTSAAVREQATPQQRMEAGFPDFTDMANLALHWLERDPATAITAFCGHGVDPALQRLAIEAALSPNGAGIPAAELLAWAKRQPSQLFDAINAVAGK